MSLNLEYIICFVVYISDIYNVLILFLFLAYDDIDTNNKYHVRKLVNKICNKINF